VVWLLGQVRERPSSARVEALGTLVVVGDEGNDLGLSAGDIFGNGAGFAVTIHHIGGPVGREEAVVIELTLQDNR